MRLAYFSPLPPQSSGIADYSAALLPYLAEHAEIDLFVDCAGIHGEIPLAARFRCQDAATFRDPGVRRQYDAALYHLGNNPFHSHVYRALRDHPGVAVLHDAVLHNLIIHETLAQGDPAGYVAALSVAYGEAGARLGLAVVNGEREPDYVHYPLTGPAVGAATGVIVHSRYLLERVRQEFPGVPVVHVPHFSFSLIDPAAPSRDAAWARARIGLRPDQLLIGSFGFIVGTKRIDVALRAFRDLHARLPEARYLIVGEGAPEIDLPRLIREQGLEHAVTLTGNVPEDEFLDYLAAVDVCVSLRSPPGGESSGAFIRMLGLGKAAIVSRVGSFFEFPDDVCLKVAPGPREVADLAEAMYRLGTDPARRRELGAAALAWIAGHHRPEDAAAAYVEFIQTTLDGAAPAGRSSRSLWCAPVAAALVDLDLGGLAGPALEDLARTIVEVAGD